MNNKSTKWVSPNESVNLELGCIFIAIPKTGTSSIRHQVRSKGPYMISTPHLNIAQVKSILYPYFLTCNLGLNRELPSTENVATDQEVREHSKKIFATTFKFASVRNPWARTLSLFKRKEGIQSSEKLTFSEFVQTIRYASDTCHHPLKTKCQIDWLKDKNGKLCMDYIFKLEELDAAINEISELTRNRIKLENIQINTGNSPRGKLGKAIALLQRKNKLNLRQKPTDSYRAAYSDQDKKTIEKLFAEDIDYFKYSF